MMDKEKTVKILEMIAEDAKNDAKEFDGQPFNGKIVAAYFGNHGASIAALAKIIELVIKEMKNDNNNS